MCGGACDPEKVATYATVDIAADDAARLRPKPRRSGRDWLPRHHVDVLWIGRPKAGPSFQESSDDLIAFNAIGLHLRGHPDPITVCQRHVLQERCRSTSGLCDAWSIRARCHNFWGLKPI